LLVEDKQRHHVGRRRGYRPAVAGDCGRFFVIDRAVFALLIEWGFNYTDLMTMELREIVGWHETIASIQRRRADAARG
jgi:hypothetical protein